MSGGRGARRNKELEKRLGSGGKIQSNCAAKTQKKNSANDDKNPTKSESDAHTAYTKLRTKLETVLNKEFRLKSWRRRPFPAAAAYIGCGFLQLG